MTPDSTPGYQTRWPDFKACPPATVRRPQPFRRRNMSGGCPCAMSSLVYKNSYMQSTTPRCSALFRRRSRRILTYDRIHSTDYAEILEIYIRRSGSIQQAAADTGTHRNTINNKIKAIRELFGLKLDYDDIANLVLAFAIRELSPRGL